MHLPAGSGPSLETEQLLGTDGFEYSLSPVEVAWGSAKEACAAKGQGTWEVAPYAGASQVRGWGGHAHVLRT